jgi:hypothetical protein
MIIWIIQVSIKYIYLLNTTYQTNNFYYKNNPLGILVIPATLTVALAMMLSFCEHAHVNHEGQCAIAHLVRIVSHFVLFY